MFELSVWALCAFLCLVVYADWSKTRDPFYPTIYLCPQLAFIYVVYPLQGMLADRELFQMLAGGQDELISYQLAVLVFLSSFIVGIRVGTVKGQRQTSSGRTWSDDALMYRFAIIFAGVGVAGWLFLVAHVGGFDAAYGRAYGGGWSDSGYVREAMYLGLVPPPLVMLARRHKGLRLVDWGVIAISAAPIIAHGLLGARRGPTFIVLATICAGYVMIFRKRVPLIVLAAGGLAVGCLLLFLVANRGGIYLGSDASWDMPLFDYLLPSNSNEYLYGCSIFRFVNATASFHGLRVVAHLIGHVIPAQIWPSKYSDLISLLGADADLEVNSGVPNQAIAAIVGWMPAVGSAPAMFGDFWLEFGASSLLAVFAIGWLYGRVWRLGRIHDTFSVLYLVLVAMSVYLTTQGIEAWAFRVLLIGLPGWTVTRWAMRRRGVPPGRPVIEGKVRLNLSNP